MSEYLHGIRENTFKRDLSIRFALFLSVFIVMLLTSYFVSSLAISARENDSVLVNVAARQRMLIHRYTSEINQVLVGLAASDLEMVLAEKSKADRTAALFEKIHEAFVSGGEIHIDSKHVSDKDGDAGHLRPGSTVVFPPLKNEEMLMHLKHVDEEWRELKRITLLSLRSNTQSISKNRYVRQLLDQAIKSVAEMDYVVHLMQRESEIKLRRLDFMLLLMAIIGSVIFLLIVYFVHSRIVVPLDSTIRDLNSTKETLEIEKARVEKASQAKSDFLSSMSHELRTPMNAILGFAQLLKLDAELNEKQQGNTDEILKAGHHLLELINEVLDLAKVESGKIDLSIEPVKLSVLVNECFVLIAPLAASLEISISQKKIGEHFVRADRTRLKQVLINLLSNAIKYNRKQGKVELDLLPVNDAELRITISDTGNGVAAERLDELFLPFNRLDAEGGEIEGTGIGLAITRQLVEMMAGRIGVDSELGVGSRFWVELPMALSGLPVEQEENVSVSDLSTVVHEHRSTVLYIEDNPTNLKLVSQILANRENVNLITAHEPELGLELAGVHQPDLILLDINMPRINGYQVLKILKLDERLKHIPVVAVTAKAMTKDIEKGKAVGFTDYLIKPLDIPHFLAVIDQYLTQP